MQIDPKSYNMESTKFSGVVGGINKLNHLKVVRLEGFADSNEEIFFAKCLRPLFKARPVIITKLNGTCSRYLVEVLNLEEQGKCRYWLKFVKDFHEICPDHVHMNL